MAVKRRRFTREFKLQVVRYVKFGKPIAQAACEYLLHPIMIGRRRREHLRYAERVFPASPRQERPGPRARS